MVELILMMILFSIAVGLTILGLFNIGSTDMSCIFPKYHWKVVNHYIKMALRLTAVLIFFTAANYMWVLYGGAL